MARRDEALPHGHQHTRRVCKERATKAGAKISRRRPLFNFRTRSNSLQRLAREFFVQHRGFIDKRRQDGRGLFLMRKLMHRVERIPVPHGSMVRMTLHRE